MSNKAITLPHYLLQQLRRASEDPELSILFMQIALAGKTLAREIRRAPLVGRLGLVGEHNPTGDAQTKLDVFANEVVADALSNTGLVAAIVSEENEEVHQITCEESAPYIVCTDPIDGSSNTDTNGQLGMIFGIYRRQLNGCCQAMEELKHAPPLVAASYILFGPSTLLVYTHGLGVHGFTLDPGIGEFLLSHESIRCPEHGRDVAADVGRYKDWDPAVRAFADRLVRSPANGNRVSLRHGGALVGDLHRILLEGGIFFYPPNAEHPDGKLRLLYECAPLAFVVEQAGGSASTGYERVLDLRPDSPHQRIPLVIGSSALVRSYELALAGPKE